MRSLTVAGLIGVGLFNVACGSESSTPAKPIKLAWIPKGAAITAIFNPGRAGAVLAGSDLTVASGRQVTVDVRETEQVDAAAQIELVQSVVDEGYDGFAVSALDAVNMTPLIDQAVDKGMHVMTFDSDAPASKRESYYGISNIAGGQKAAQLLAKLTDGKGQIAILTSSDGSKNFADRVDSFTEALTEFPDMEIVDTAKCGAAEEAATGNCTSYLEDWVTAYPNLTGVYFARARALREPDMRSKVPLYAAAVDAGRLHAVGFDAVPEQLNSMSDGMVHALLGQKLFGWGYDVSNMLFDSIVAGINQPAFVDSGFDVVCPNNLAEMMAVWQSEDYRTPLSSCSL